MNRLPYSRTRSEDTLQPRILDSVPFSHSVPSLHNLHYHNLIDTYERLVCEFKRQLNNCTYEMECLKFEIKHKDERISELEKTIQNLNLKKDQTFKHKNKESEAKIYPENDETLSLDLMPAS